MQPFTLDQTIITALLFILGILIGMYFLAGGKWKRLYRAEVQRREALESDNEKLRSEAREMESLRHAAAKSPAQPSTVTRVDTTPASTEAYRRDDQDAASDPDIVIRRP